MGTRLDRVTAAGQGFPVQPLCDQCCVILIIGAVALKDNTELTYTGEAQTPEVNVTVDGIALAVEKYQLSYDNNINAGNTAKVTVTGTTFTGS